MTAAWWWIDRWRKSTAYTDMTAEEQGLYRNLLDEVWLRESHVIPDDQRILAKVSGDPDAWSRCGAKVLKWMTRVQDGWTHTTAQEIIHQSQRRADNQARYRERLSHDRLRHNNGADNASDNGVDNRVDNKPDSPSPSPSPSPSLVSVSDKKLNPSTKVNGSGGVKPLGKGAGSNGNGRSKRPIFQGQRFVVFDWQLEDLSRLLGPHTDAFDLHSWFFDLDAKMEKQKTIVPQRDGGRWLQEQATAEARRRGLSLAPAVSENGMVNAATFARVAKQIQERAK